MISKIRRLGDAEFMNVEHDADDCPFCEAARGATCSGVVFFESDSAGDSVQRVEVEMAADRSCAMLCREVSRSEAQAEIASGDTPAARWTRPKTHDRLTLEKLRELELAASTPGLEFMQVRPHVVAELVRSYRANCSDLPEVLQSLGTFGSAFAGAFAGSLFPRRSVLPAAEKSRAQAKPIKQKPKRRRKGPTQ